MVRLLCDRVVVMYLGRVIESGPAAALFTNPRHPYTRALLSAIPGATVDGAAVERIRLGGEVRSPIDPSPTVCRFYGRCPQGQGERCTTQMPLLHEVGVEHSVACHFA